MMQRHAVTPVTLLPMIVHTAGVVLVNVTGVKPLSDVALTVPVPPTLILGATPKVRVCVPAPMLMLQVAAALAARLADAAAVTV